MNKIEQKKAQEKWVSVEDELPKNDGYLLVCTNDYGTQSVLYGYYHNKIFQVPMGVGGFNEVEPTHWQPLPEPPKE